MRFDVAGLLFNCGCNNRILSQIPKHGAVKSRKKDCKTEGLGNSLSSTTSYLGQLKDPPAWAFDATPLR